MELEPIINFLRDQRSILDETIACLERLNPEVAVYAERAPAKRRGRKFMDPQDRAKVSLRMKEYWATRRLGKNEHAESAA